MKPVRIAASGVLLVLGIVLVTWAAYAFSVAASGGDADISPTGWAILATIGAVIGVGLIYLAWCGLRCVRRTSPHR